MLATYRITTIPVGALKRERALGTVGVPFSYVLDLEFASTAALSPSNIQEILAANPFWSSDVRLAATMTNGQGIHVHSQNLVFDEVNRDLQFSRLSQYFQGSSKITQTAVTPRARLHDPRFDRLESGQVLDMAQLFRDVVVGRTALALRFATLLDRTSSVAPRSRSRFASAVHECAGVYAAVMRRELALAGDNGLTRLRVFSGIREESRTTEDKMLNQLFESIITELPKFVAILNDSGYRPSTVFATSRNEGVVSADELKAHLADRDPNTLTAALLRDPALSAALGLVGRGVAWFDEASIKQIAEGKFRLLVSNQGIDRSVSIEPGAETAVNLSEHFVAVRSRSQGSHHNLLTWLNTVGGGERYKATTVNADHEVQKAWLMGRPSSARLNTSDQESMSEAGISQMTSPGVVFSAPSEDIIAPPPGGNSGDALYFEDLLIGYRIDIASKEHPQYRSLHEQQSSYSLDGLPGEFLSVRTEGFADREQIRPNGYITTDFALWNGMGASQAVPWRKINATIDQDDDTPRIFVREDKSIPKTLPRLEYSQNYWYRLRPVFQGGTGPKITEADEFYRTLGSKQQELYRQNFFYPRANHFSAGVIVLPTEGKNADSTNGIVYVANRGQNRVRTIYVLPSALTIDEARFHGLFGRTISEHEALRGVSIVTDPKALASWAGNSGIYFCDPDVEEVLLEVWEVGRPKDSMKLTVDAGEALESVPDVFVDRVTLPFGETGKWQTFRPVMIEIRADNCEKTLLRRSGHAKSMRSAAILLPPGRNVELRLSPVVRERARLTTAIPVHVSRALGTNFSAEVEKMVETYEKEEQVVGAVHVATLPLQPPVIEAMAIERLPDESSGKVLSRIQVDAPTTSEIELLLSWRDVTTESDGMTEFAQDRSTKVGVRPIRFGRRPLQLRSLMSYDRNLMEIARVFENGLDFSAKYYCENLVLYGEQGGTPANGGVVDFPDGRRRTVTAVVAAKARNIERIADFDSTGRITSAPFVFVVSNTILPPPPVLRGVTTLRQELAPKQHSDNGTTVATKFAFSIEIAPRWNYTGEGEKLAVAFHADSSDGSPFEAPVSRWGEDIFERPKLRSTRRSPTPQDFVSLTGDHEYMSDLPLAYAVGDEVRTVSADFAVFALTANRIDGFWSCDIAVNTDFYGWLKLALFRYQPQSVEGRSLSRFPTWAYVRQFQKRVLTMTKNNGFIELRVGPYSDITVTFDICRVERLSHDVLSEPTNSLLLQQIKTDAGFIHYCRIRQDGPMLLRQKRLGSPYDSLIID